MNEHIIGICKLEKSQKIVQLHIPSHSSMPFKHILQTKGFA